ncbi:MAG TPA: hypothetical protein VGV93_08195 [Acidimicrobiales bacterium]|nr:hypothetical protein [Acidimicrobiales bacterium]
MSTVSEIVDVLSELSLLTQRDPDALARREEILATKAALIERIRTEEDEHMPADESAPPNCAREGCEEPVVRNSRGRPAMYCSPSCRPSRRARRRPPVVVDVEHPDTSPDGRPVQRVWTVALRRGMQTVTIADNLGWPSAHALARQLEELLGPLPHRGGAID